MPLTQEQEDAEYERRMDQMAVNIDKMHADMRWEAKRFLLQVVTGAAACVAAGAAIATLVLHLTGKL